MLGELDVTTTELYEAALNGLRLTALALAFAAYALLLDHDRLVSSAGFARRSALAVALATRLVPSLERDARGLAEAVRGRGVRLEGARGYATLVSPLVAGSLERASNLAEAMEARGFGRPGTTRPRAALERARPRPSRWRRCWWSRERCGSSVRQRAVVRLPARRAGGPGRVARTRARGGGRAARIVRFRQVDAAARPRGPRSPLPRRAIQGRVVVAELDTRRSRPAELAGTVATVFQDPEDQVVMTMGERGRVRAGEPRLCAG